MPMYITYAKYSHSGVKGMIDSPRIVRELLRD